MEVVLWSDATKTKVSFDYMVHYMEHSVFIILVNTET